MVNESGECFLPFCSPRHLDSRLGAVTNDVANSTNPDCNLWFSFSDASSIVQAGTKSTQQKTTIANLPYTISDELTKSNEEYFSRFKAIKIKPASKLVGSSVEKTTIFACKKCDTHLAFEQNIVSTVSPQPFMVSCDLEKVLAANMFLELPRRTWKSLSHR